MAKDKAWTDVSSDSLIEQSADWFAALGDSRREMLSRHYLARVRYARGRYADAIILALQALDLARAANDPLHMSLAARTIADSYSAIYNPVDALEFSKQAYQYICREPIQPNLNYALFDLAWSFAASADYANGFKYATMAYDSAVAYNDTNLIIESEKLRAETSFKQGKFQDAVDLYESVIDYNTFASVDSVCLGASYIELGRLDDARRMLSGERLSSDMFRALLEYEYYSAIGKSDSAYLAIKNSYDDLNNITNQRISQNVSSSIVKYYELSKAMYKEQVEKTKFYLCPDYCCSFNGYYNS